MTPNSYSVRTNSNDSQLAEASTTEANTITSRLQEESAKRGGSKTATRKLPEYPRIGEVLKRMRSQPATATKSVDEALDHMANGGYSAIVGESITMPPPPEILRVVQFEEVEAVKIDTPYAIAAAQAAIDIPPMPAIPEKPSHTPTSSKEMVEIKDSHAHFEIAAKSMQVAHFARELVRTRMIVWAQAQRQRTTYELVFLMLAFSVMVLICVPPLIQLVRAIQGAPIS